MKRLQRAALALLLAAGASPVLAQESDAPDLRPYFNGGYEYSFADHDRKSDDGNGSWLGYGWSLNKFWGLEVQGNWDQFNSESSSKANNWRQWGAQLDGLFFYSRNPSFSPYVVLGAGGMKQEQRNPLGNAGHDSSINPFIESGVGFFSYFGETKTVGIRLDARYRWLDTDSDYANVSSFGEPVIKIGLVTKLGAVPEAAPVAPVVKDSDGDGVLDDADLCPGTPKGVKVDAKGCPIDSDGDGVPDGIDQCPGTPPGVAVDDKGCPTTLGSGRFKITGSGADLRFEDVHFEFDKSNLSDYAKEMLDDASNVIEQVSEKYPGLKVDVSGHTDSVGTEGYNQGLSERRANAVKDYLIRKGVEAGRISTYAYGESKPIASNDTAEGRAQNRRAETRTRGE
ncbi:OmpA family protein [Solimonas marina]|uniref:OmpA family protein n=1 Tax=Solimonas marina TaxID=2714601 RepID=A0A970B3U1_9GAMM|nr:OmpA family protein [Solimonas marina]NKF21622.1 OmpA family protein [Solimonas marina]